MKIKIAVILVISLVLFSFTFDRNIDYSQYKEIERSDLKQIDVEPKVINLVGKIRLEEVTSEFIKDNNIFPFYEGWVVKKYGIEKFEGDLVIDGKRTIDDIDGFQVGRKEYVGIRFTDEYGNLVYFISPFVVVYDNDKNRDYPLLDITDNVFKYETDRLIDVKGEWIFVVAWQKEIFDAGTSNIDLLKFNIKEKTVEIFDAYDYGIFCWPFVEDHQYDISNDRRYIYMVGIDYRSFETMPEGYYKREEVKINKGLYVYDWWENKLFRLVDEGIKFVVNNTEDGYVYIKKHEYYDKKWHDSYHRLKNPEELLKK